MTVTVCIERMNEYACGVNIINIALFSVAVPMDYVMHVHVPILSIQGQ